MDRLEKLEWEMRKLKLSITNIVRYGKVVEVEGRKVRVEFDAGEKSNWLDYKIKAGKVKISAPIHVGERVEIISPLGDTSQGKVGPLGATDDTPAAAGGDDDYSIEIEDVSIVATPDGVTIKKGETEVKLTAADIELTATKIKINGDTIIDGEVTIEGDLIAKGKTYHGGDKFVATTPMLPSPVVFTI